MKWKGSFDNPDRKETDEGQYEGEAYPFLENPKSKIFSMKFLRGNEIPILLISVGILALIFLFVIFTPGRPKSPGTSTVAAVLEPRIEDLEGRLVKLEEIVHSMTQLGGQSNDYGMLMDRIDKLEAALSLRNDYLNKEMEDLKQKMAAVPSKQTVPAQPVQPQAAKAAPKQSKPRYHQVRPGETLYRIGRTYGISVEALQRLNKLSPGVAIYPGQKLLVSQ